MKELNLGIAKAIISNKLTNEFINESTVDNSKNLISGFVNIIKESPALMVEYVVINNIENKHINNDVLASKFIDENLKLFSGDNYKIFDNHNIAITKDMIKEGHSKLFNLIGDVELENISESKIKLYNSISNLLLEGIDVTGDITKIHDSYCNVLTYLKENVSVVIEEEFKLNENLNIDNVVEIATEKFNKKYATLTEDEIKLVNDLVYCSSKEKKNIFETLKQENIDILSTTETNGVEDKIHEAIERLNNMKYDENSVSTNIVNLHNLKVNLN